MLAPPSSVVAQDSRSNGSPDHKNTNTSTNTTSSEDQENPYKHNRINILNCEILGILPLHTFRSLKRKS